MVCIAKLDRFQQTLLMVVTIALILGLLGTVLGIINTFDVIASHCTRDVQELSIDKEVDKL